MSSYRGDGYGVYGDHGDDNYRFGEDRDDRSRGNQRWRDEREEGRGLFRGGRGDDDWQRGDRDHDRDDSPSRGATHGNLMGQAEHKVRDWVEGGRDHRDDRLSDDPRATRAADDWNRRFGREGYEGSYGLHDDSYRSFRQRHLDEMDRDYDAWRGERQQEFGRDFDGWRSQRQGRSSDRPADEMPALELSDAAHATSPETPVTAEQQPAAAGSPASRRRGSSGSTPGETATPTDGLQDR